MMARRVTDFTRNTTDPDGAVASVRHLFGAPDEGTGVTRPAT